MRFTKDHEWAAVEGDHAVVGVSAYAAGQLGDVVFVELPEVGKTLKAGDNLAVVESVKAASDVYAPLAGTITEINDILPEDPGLINRDAGGEGWFFRMELEDDDAFEALMDDEAYTALLETL